MPDKLIFISSIFDQNLCFSVKHKNFVDKPQHLKFESVHWHIATSRSFSCSKSVSFNLEKALFQLEENF